MYSNIEKEELHREHWAKIFNDEKEEGGNNEYIFPYLNNNLQRITPFENTNMARLDTGCIDSKMTIDKVKQIIKKIKKSCPGESGINTIILKELPNEGLLRLTNIFNNTLSAGYFPNIWKKAIVRLTPKSGKTPHKVENYRPISLLE